MSAYQVLARKWRPQRFEDLVGQDVVVRTLRNALASQQIAHAYLFSGLRGVGKTTVARLLAKALNCEKGPTAEPCGVCPACVDITAGSALDVLEIDAASNTGVDDVRELREIIRNLPIRDRYRVVILDEAHQLSKSAFAALLKILEEPPAHVIFVLASTEKHKFPATILSRCHQIDFRPIPNELLVARLEQIAAAEGFALAPGAAQLVARAAEGSLRDALSLLDRVRAFGEGDVDEAGVTEVLGLPPIEVILALWEAIAAGDLAQVLAVLRAEERAGHDPEAIYEELVLLLHSLLLLACDPSAPLPYPEQRRAALVEDTKKVGLPLVIRMLGLAIEQRQLLANAERPALAVAVVLGRLAMWPRLQRVEALLAGETSGSAPAQSGPTRGGTVPPRRASSPAPAAGPAAHAALESPLEALVRSLEEIGAPTVAARVHKASEAVVNGETLVLRFPGVPTATLQSVRDAAAQLSAAAGRAGLPVQVRIEANGDLPADNHAANGLRARVEADERVKRVLGVFGGRIERVEEKS